MCVHAVLCVLWAARAALMLILAPVLIQVPLFPAHILHVTGRSCTVLPYIAVQLSHAGHVCAELTLLGL